MTTSEEEDGARGIAEWYASEARRKDRMARVARQTGATAYVPSEGEGEFFQELQRSLKKPDQTQNAFCPTGKGGGVDPTCPSNGTRVNSRGEVLHEVTRTKSGLWKSRDGSPAPAHIQKLGIPPGWRDVAINPDPKGTMLASGWDSKGRAVYKYSDTYTAKKAAEKFGRVSELREKRGQIFKEIERDMKTPELKERAECLKLIMQTGMRPGSDTDTKADHKSYGATTLEGRHVISDRGGTRLRLVTGKNKGREVEFPIQDPVLARSLRDRARAAGPSGRIFKTSAEELRGYSKDKDGKGFKTKDHRTALGTETAIKSIKDTPTPRTAKMYKASVKAVATSVSKVLGNTPSIALKSYIDPQVWTAWRKAAGV